MDNNLEPLEIFKDLDLSSSSQLGGIAISLLHDNAEGVSLMSDSSMIGYINSLGVDGVINCKNSFDSFDDFVRTDSFIELFEKKYFVRKRANNITLFTEFNSNDFYENFRDDYLKFISYCFSGNGLSFIGARNEIYNMKLTQMLYKDAPSSACTISFQSGKYIVSEYSKCGNYLLSTVFKDSIKDVFSFVSSSLYDAVFVEAFNGFSAISESLDLARVGKSVIYVDNSASSCLTLYSSVAGLDRDLFSSLFRTSMTIGNVCLLNSELLPKIEFKRHPLYDRLSQMNSSPNKDSFVVVSNDYDLNDVACGNIIISEVIVSNKTLINAINNNSSPNDIASSLRTDLGWKSLIDKSFNYVKNEIVSIDQVIAKISLI